MPVVESPVQFPSHKMTNVNVGTATRMDWSLTVLPTKAPLPHPCRSSRPAALQQELTIQDTLHFLPCISSIYAEDQSLPTEASLLRLISQYSSLTNSNCSCRIKSQFKSPTLSFCLLKVSHFKLTCFPR